MAKKKILPHEGAYTRLKKSRIHGVGVFAIIDIPEGENIFKGDQCKMTWINSPAIHLKKLPIEIQKLYLDFCVVKKIGKQQMLGCPTNFNNMPISWFLNESKKPNVYCNSSYNFFAIRKIKVGEELTVDYDTYSD